jgi:hypothetical protein
VSAKSLYFTAHQEESSFFCGTRSSTTRSLLQDKFEYDPPDYALFSPVVYSLEDFQPKLHKHILFLVT